MGLLLGGIVKGAINLGAKLIKKSRSRKAARKARRDKKQLEKDLKLSQSIEDLKLAIASPGGVAPGIIGADETSQSANVLNQIKKLTSGEDTDVVTVAEPQGGGGGGGFDFQKFIKTPMGIGILLVVGFFVLKKMRIIK